MSKWIVDETDSRDNYAQVLEECILSDGDKCWGHVCSLLSKEKAQQIVREHNAHAELLICLKAMLKITCGECRGENPGKCVADPLACALSSQARAAIEAAEG